MKKTNFETSYKYKCKCGRNNHIHPEIHQDTKKLMYYCGECGFSYLLRDSIKVEEVIA